MAFAPARYFLRGGVSLVFGFDDNPTEKWMAFGFNAGGLVLGAAAVYIALVSRAEAARAR